MDKLHNSRIESSLSASRPYKLTRLLAGLGLVAALLFGLIGTSSSPVARSALVGPTVTLYDAALGNTPDAQKFSFFNNPFAPPGSQSYDTNEQLTVLNTVTSTNRMAGYFSKDAEMPVMTRTLGYTVRFTAQLVSENHAPSDKNGDGIGDRAGFSIIVLGSDSKGIELGFWENEIWAQNDCNAQPPCFLHGEGNLFNTTALTTYDLTILGNRYTLSSSGIKILTGQVRDYSGFNEPPFAFIYQKTNFIFLGDDTGSALALSKLGTVAVTTDIRATALHVTNLSDATNPPVSPITLREALVNAAALGGGTITFDPALKLDNPPPQINLVQPLTVGNGTSIDWESCNNLRLRLEANFPAAMQLTGSAFLRGLDIRTSSGPGLRASGGGNSVKCTTVVKSS